MPVRRLRRTVSSTRPVRSRISTTRRASLRLYAARRAGSSRQAVSISWPRCSAWKELALAEDGLGRGIQAVVVELHEGAAEEREAVQHLAPREDHPRIASEAEVPSHLGLLVRPPERQAKLGPRRATRWRTVTSKSPMFQPVRTSGSAARRWPRKAWRHARSLGTGARRSCPRGGPGAAPTRRSAPPIRGHRPGRPSRSSRESRPSRLVSMSSESIRSFGSKAAGSRRGFR